MEISCLLDAASEETLRLYQIGVDDTAAEEAFVDHEAAANDYNARHDHRGGMRATASAVLHFEWTETSSSLKRPSGAALGVLVAGPRDKPLPDRLPDWVAARI